MAGPRSGISVMLCFAVGCGSRSHKESANHATIAQGSVTAGCSGAMVGAGSNDWRPLATAVGRFGVYGSGRDFRTAQKTPVSLFRGLQRRQVSGPILVTKTPLVVEGKDPVEVSIVPDDRARAGLVVPPFGFRGGPYGEVRFVPCRDQPRTWWPAGWALRNPDPVTVVVHQANWPESQLVVGRP